MNLEMRVARRLVFLLVLASALAGNPALAACPRLFTWTKDRSIGLTYGNVLPKAVTITEAMTGNVVYAFGADAPANSLPTYGLGGGGGCEVATTCTGVPVQCAVIMTQQPGDPPPPNGVYMSAPGAGFSFVVPDFAQADPNYSVVIGPETANIVNYTGYRVKATCDGTSWVTIDVMPPGPIAGPGVKAVSTNPVTIAWNYVAGAPWAGLTKSYGVLYSSAPRGPFTGIVAGLTTSTYTFPAGKLGGDAYVAVSAINQKGQWGPPRVLKLTLPPATPPDVWGVPAYSAVASFGAVQLEWPASMGATSYKVARGTSASGPFTDIASPLTNTVTDTGLTMGATYHYVVRALGPTGNSGNSPVRAVVVKKYIPVG